ncbi:MAG: HAD family hydrolase [SAR324 cluster bacterium]|nr:HAD family hydrolase [SAR324 cluster bacterium]
MEVFCFDFDGVVCDSAPETALAAWNACQTLWPKDSAPLPEALQQRFCVLRPVMHTGYEAVPLMRLIKDGAVDDAGIMDGFDALRDRFIEREGLSIDRLQQVFGAARDSLIAADQAQWLRWNRFYPGMGEALGAAIERHPLYIVTTKQERFVELLLGHHQLQLPSGRIFGLERKRSKPEILTELTATPKLEGGKFHFIEDRLDTLLKVMKLPALDQVALYLVDWGYNTPAQREQAASTGRIKVVSMDQFRGMHGF